MLAYSYLSSPRDRVLQLTHFRMGEELVLVAIGVSYPSYVVYTTYELTLCGFHKVHILCNTWSLILHDSSILMGHSNPQHCQEYVGC